ncbi:hypothetical protein TIFTF001_030300 [Ficus carica]|uniref:Uncharacterized protein n=1 Tax=Ficus carica TaxID=3494 RepID=A0AA88DTW2_FICCA|nr:hypothetical protein TIFTF001_030300 [Ficus carica]
MPWCGAPVTWGLVSVDWASPSTVLVLFNEQWSCSKFMCRAGLPRFESRYPVSAGDPQIGTVAASARSVRLSYPVSSAGRFLHDSVETAPCPPNLSATTSLSLSGDRSCSTCDPSFSGCCYDDDDGSARSHCCRSDRAPPSVSRRRCSATEGTIVAAPDGVISPSPRAHHDLDQAGKSLGPPPPPSPSLEPATSFSIVVVFRSVLYQQSVVARKI